MSSIKWRIRNFTKTFERWKFEDKKCKKKLVKTQFSRVLNQWKPRHILKFQLFSNETSKCVLTFKDSKLDWKVSWLNCVFTISTLKFHHFSSFHCPFRAFYAYQFMNSSDILHVKRSRNFDKKSQHFYIASAMTGGGEATGGATTSGCTFETTALKFSFHTIWASLSKPTMISRILSKNSIDESFNAPNLSPT